MFPPSAWMPNGAKPFAILASVKPVVGTALNDASKTSTLPLWKSVAYSLSFMTARPLKIAPAPVAPGIAVAAFTVGDQPRIVPASVAKRKRAAPLFPFWETVKSAALPLKTGSVGPPGTAAVRATLLPAPLHSVEVFVPFFDVHHGVVGPALRPQPLTRFASVESVASEWTV